MPCCCGIGRLNTDGAVSQSRRNLLMTPLPPALRSPTERSPRHRDSESESRLSLCLRRECGRASTRRASQADSKMSARSRKRGHSSPASAVEKNQAEERSFQATAGERLLCVTSFAHANVRRNSAKTNHQRRTFFARNFCTDSMRRVRLIRSLPPRGRPPALRYGRQESSREARRNVPSSSSGTFGYLVLKQRFHSCNVGIALSRSRTKSGLSLSSTPFEIRFAFSFHAAACDSIKRRRWVVGSKRE